MNTYIINKLPEVIKCIIFDHVSGTLNYEVELLSDKFIGNPIDLYNIYPINNYYYHINKLTRIKTPLHFIGLRCKVMPPQEIYNKLQKFFFAYGYYERNLENLENLQHLQCIKILTIFGLFIEIPNIIGLLELDCHNCCNLIEIPNIMGLKKLNCSACTRLIKIPNIIGLLELNCSYCSILTEIPHIVGLKKLNCACTNITEIPHIVGLLELNCFSCRKLTDIPNIKGLLKVVFNLDSLRSIL